jgi:hypothetical protein
MNPSGTGRISPDGRPLRPGNKVLSLKPAASAEIQLYQPGA